MTIFLLEKSRIQSCLVHGGRRLNNPNKVLQTRKGPGEPVTFSPHQKPKEVGCSYH